MVLIWQPFLFAQVNPSVVNELESAGMKFVGHDVDGKRMEILELQGFLNCFITVKTVDNGVFFQ